MITLRMSDLTFSQQVDIKITNRINFFIGQVTLHKIAYAETGDEKHLESMKEFQHSVNLLEFLRGNSYAIAKENRELKNKLNDE